MYIQAYLCIYTYIDKKVDKNTLYHGLVVHLFQTAVSLQLAAFYNNNNNKK